MDNAKFNNIEANQIARDKLKELIKKYNLSRGEDRKALEDVLEYVGKTPLFLAFAKGVAEGKSNVITLTASGTVFVPVFTATDEIGKLAENADIVLMKASEYIPMVLDMNHHIVINPFGDYFLLWPELMREHMLPYIQEYDSFAAQNFNMQNFSGGLKS